MPEFDEHELRYHYLPFDKSRLHYIRYPAVDDHTRVQYLRCSVRLGLAALAGSRTAQSPVQQRTSDVFALFCRYHDTEIAEYYVCNDVQDHIKIRHLYTHVYLAYQKCYYKAGYKAYRSHHDIVCGHLLKI